MFACRYKACVVTSTIIIKMICPCPMVQLSVSHSLEIAGKWKKTVMQGKHYFVPSIFLWNTLPLLALSILQLCNIRTVCMRFFSSTVKSSKEKNITTRNHHTGQMEITAIFLILTHTWGIKLWSSPQCGHSLCLLYTEKST